MLVDFDIKFYEVGLFLKIKSHLYSAQALLCPLHNAKTKQWLLCQLAVSFRAAATLKAEDRFLQWIPWWIPIPTENNDHWNADQTDNWIPFWRQIAQN